MFNRLKSIFRSRTPPKPLVRARFDAAQTTRDNSLSAPGLMRRRRHGTTGVTGRRRIICRRTWRPRRKSAGRCGCARATKLPTIPTPEDWCRCSQTTPSARGRDCRCYPPTRRSLDLQLIEADRVSGELRWFEDDTSVDGISYDRWGNPTDYRVLKYHPGDIRYMPGDDAIHIPAEYMIHIYRQDRPGLHRGVPEITPALPLFAQLRRYNLAVLSTAAVCSTSQIQSGCAFRGGGRSGFCGDSLHGRSAERRIG